MFSALTYALDWVCFSFHEKYQFYIICQVQLYMKKKKIQIDGHFGLDTYSYEGVKEFILIFFTMLIKLYGGMQCPTWLKPMTC